MAQEVKQSLIVLGPSLQMRRQ